MRRQTVLAIAVLLVAGRNLIKSLERSAANDIAQRIHSRNVTVRLQADSPFDYLSAKVDRITVRASGFAVEELPFTIDETAPKTGKIDRFVIELRDAQLAGLRAERVFLEAPNVYFDLGVAIKRRVFQLSASGTGRAEIVVTEQSLADFIMRKYKGTVRDITVRITPDKTVVEGKALVIVGEASFRAEGVLRPREGIYLDLAELRLWLDGRETDPQTGRTIAAFLNPVIDAVKDLKVSDALRIDELELLDGKMIGRGPARAPLPMDVFLKRSRP